MTRSPKWTADDMPDQSGRTVIVTGATSGLGLVTATQLARHGAHVIMAVRDRAAGQRVAGEVTARHPQARLEVRGLDISDLDAVRAFADDIRRDEIEVELLINNAGVAFPRRQLTPQGHELQFATNHLGHFALTGLLLETLSAGKDPRVVTVSSVTHRRARIRFDDLTGARRYSRVGFYAQSKLAITMFGLELHRRLRAAGTPVRSVLAHPGYTATNLQTSGPTGLLKLLGRAGNLVLAQNAAIGALPQLYAATHPDVECGQFIGPDGPLESRGHPTFVQPAPVATDPEATARLWELSERLTGVAFPP